MRRQRRKQQQGGSGNQTLGSGDDNGRNNEVGEHKPIFHDWIFQNSTVTNQQAGFTRRNNFSNTKVLQPQTKSFHLQDEALQWYQWYERFHPNIQLEDFT